jgi:hypothetical protein
MYKLIALSAIAAISSASNMQAGLGMSLTQNGVTNAKNVIVPLLFSKAVDISVPDYSADGLSLTNIVATATAPTDLSEIDIAFGAAQNSVGLSSSGVGTHITADFAYKVLFSTITGQMDITVTDAGLDTTVDLSTQNVATLGGEMAPFLTCESVALKVDPSNVTIKLTGGAVDKIASSLISLMKSSILPEVITGVQDSLKTAIDVTANQDLAEYGVQEPIPGFGGLAIDYSQIHGPIIASDSTYMKMDVNGTWFDSSDMSFDPHLTPSTFELRDTAGKDLQLYITEYFINSLYASAFNTGNTLDVTELLQQYFNVTVDADVLAFVIPEFKDVYAEGTTIEIAGTLIDQAGVAHFSADGGAYTKFDLDIDIKANGAEAIKADLKGIEGSGVIGSSAGKITGHIDLAQVASSTVLQGSTVDSAALQTDLDAFLTYWVGYANDQLAAGIEIPSIKGIDISDVELVNHDGYIEFGASLQSS